MSKKILVVYYSWSGKTRVLAEKIANQKNADIFEIKPKEPYSKIYSECVSRGKKEFDEKKWPEISENISIKQYDEIFIGSPNWFGTLTPPVISFLEKNNFPGMKIIPFGTHGGGGLKNFKKTIEEYCPDAVVLECI